MTVLTEGDFPDSNLDFNTLLSDLANVGSDEDETVPTPYDLHGLKCNYWETDKLCNLISSTNNNLFLHINIQCLPAKFDRLITFLNELSHVSTDSLPIVLALSETWLSEDNNSSFVIEGYQPNIVSKFRRDNSSRGGVAMYVRSGYEFAERPDLDKFIPLVFESAFISLKDLNLVVGVVYTSPSADPAAFMTHYQSTISSLLQNNQNFLILGDFNADLLKYRHDSHVTEFVDSNFEMGCIPLITKATRIDRSSASCIDNIITNQITSNSESGVLVEDISDHFPIFYHTPNLHHKNQKQNVENTYLRRNFCKENLQKLNDSLASLNWEDILNEEDPNIAGNKFRVILERELDTYCPLQHIINKAKYPSQPWFTRGLKVSCRKKKLLYKKSLKNKNKIDSYRKYRNLYNKLIRLAKSNYYKNLLDRNKHDIRKTWSVLKETIFNTKQERKSPQKLDVSQEDSFTTELNDSKQIAEYFNSLFASVGHRTEMGIDKSNVLNPIDFMKHISVDETFYVFPTNESEVIKTCLNIKSKFSSGYDEISNIVAKSIIHSVAKPLAHIYNCSFQSGVFPDTYNISKIIPIYKSGDKCNAANYRPISLLTSFSKILEKMMYQRLSNFIFKHNILYDKQYGFIKGRSTEHAMLNILHKITESIEKKEYTLGTS